MCTTTKTLESRETSKIIKFKVVNQILQVATKTRWLRWDRSLTSVEAMSAFERLAFNWHIYLAYFAHLIKIPSV